MNAIVDSSYVVNVKWQRHCIHQSIEYINGSSRLLINNYHPFSLIQLPKQIGDNGITPMPHHQAPV